MIKRLSITVSGRVQGVGFRYFTQDTATSLGLTGWVANTPEGRVEMEVQGDENDLLSFKSRVQEGPPLSRVTDMLEHEMRIMEDEEGFSINH